MRIKPAGIMNIFIMAVLTFIFLYPFAYILSVSISDPLMVANGKVKLWPVGLQFNAYKVILSNPSLWLGYYNSILYSVTGTILAMVFGSIPAYVLSVKDFKYKRSFTTFFTITMFFSGGIIPSFLVIKYLGLLDTIWALIIPSSLSAWNIILFRTNFKSLPESIAESAKIDGAPHLKIYAYLIMPLSKSIIATLALFSVVALWNSYFPALLYLTSQDKQPLMIVLRKFVITSNFRGEIENYMLAVQGKNQYNWVGFERAVKMSTIAVSIGPVVFIYPFIQKYFAKGVLVGSIKE